MDECVKTFKCAWRDTRKNLQDCQPKDLMGSLPIKPFVA